MASSSNSSRDLSLVALAGLVAVVAMACTTYLAAMDKINAEAAVAIFGASGGTLAGYAIGRMSGVAGERGEDAAANAAAPPSLPSRPS